MASKQQRTGRLPPTPKKTPYSLILMNIRFNDNKEAVLNSLQRNHRGVNDITRYYLQVKDQDVVPGVCIDMQSEDLAKELINKKNIVIERRNYSVEMTGRSVIVMKVSANESIETLSRDLSHNYTTVESVSRFYDHANNPIDCILVSFKSDSSFNQAVKDKYIFVDGKKSAVQPCWSLVPVKNTQTQPTNVVQNVIEKPTQAVNGQRSTVLTEQRVRKLFAEQQAQLEAMIEEFEKKWNARLSAVANSSNNVAANQLLPVIQDLSNVCQEFAQKNDQIQRQLHFVNQRVQNVQIPLNNESEYPSLPVRNGNSIQIV